MTIIALRRALDRADDKRMRGQGKVKTFLPRSVAYLLALRELLVLEPVEQLGPDVVYAVRPDARLDEVAPSPGTAGRARVEQPAPVRRAADRVRSRFA